MSEMGPATPSAVRNWPWLKLALIASLALNLLFLGAGLARFLVHDKPERVMGLTQVQLIPRKFFGELDQDRKAELLGIFREFSPKFRDGRRASREEIAALAMALEAEPYDPARVKATVDSFSARSESLIASGGQAALTLIERLTPEERKLLAKHIRQRAGSGRGDKRGSE
jgi:uncharacterized membrane protein